MKKAIITGVTGQDGSYLSEFLLEKKYKIYGLKRRISSQDYGNVSHLLKEPNFEIVEGDLTDLTSLINLCKKVNPDEFYNLAAQSEVGTSFKQPIATAEITGIGVLNCLEAIKQSGNSHKTKFYQASSSELFGGLSGGPYNENSKFHPRSPYGIAKLAGHWYTINARESDQMFACAGILMNHESPRRGPYFVTQKIAKAVAAIKNNKQEYLYLGNLDAYRDWGHAKDYCRAMYLMLQQKQPKEYVISSEKTHSVREFCEIAFNKVGLNYKNYVKTDENLYRPAEVNVLLGDSSLAHEELGWYPEISFERLVNEMVDFQMNKYE